MQNRPDSLLQRYLQRLPSTKGEQSALEHGVEVRIASGNEPWAALHETLGQPWQHAVAEPSAASVGRRLMLGYGAACAAAGVLRSDAAGAKIAAVPPLARTPLAATPWEPNPLLRAWRRLRTARRPPAALRHRRTRWHTTNWRRLALVFAVGLQTVIATAYMQDVLPYHGAEPLEVLILILFALLFCWISSGFWTAAMGFVQIMVGHDRYSISARGLPDAPLSADIRCALVMPICNEDVGRVFAGLRATYESLARTDSLRHFDVFVLSDSDQADICVAEQQAWMELCSTVDGFGRIFYRHRRRRVKRKSGNIDDFCRRWGAKYRYMVVLDADSVMTGACLKSLVQLMEIHPAAGIIQSAPFAMGMQTLYARIQQFATRVYGPLFTAGLHFWQLGESHYWGHNAIIRLRPFMQHCILAPLPGKGAFAGTILSHDFVEAALMRRAGWGVWIAYDLPGSYEELPPNLLDELKRDQRWCHGNLMNFRLFLTDGFHPAHRAVFLIGVMSYLSAPLWFLLLVLATVLLAVHTLIEPQYFVEPHQLFPVWPQWHPGKAIALLSSTFVLLLLPKVLSVLLVCLRDPQDHGGRFKVVLSMLCEMLFSMLLAPVRMIFHTRFITAVLFGLKARWISPQRDANHTPWGEAIRRHASQTLLGLAWAGLVGWLNPLCLWWMAPILAAWLLAIPLSALTSRVDIGRKSLAVGLFRTPEETRPPKELVATHAYTLAARHHEDETPDFDAAVTDPAINALVCVMAGARHRNAPPNIEARKALVELASEKSAELSELQRIRLLDDPVAMAQLHRLAWVQ